MPVRHPTHVTLFLALVFGLGTNIVEPQSISSGHRRMLELLRDVEARAPAEHGYLSDREVRRLRTRLAELDPITRPIFELELRYQLGEAELRLGREREAIAQLTAAYELIATAGEDLAPDWKLHVIYRLGVAHLRRGETENCAHGFSPDRCILPISDAAQHRHREGSTKAIEMFLEVLAGAPDRSSLHLAARWLLNIAYMTLGEHPESVPGPYLIPPGAFASDAFVPSFTNVSQELGLSSFTLSGSVVAADFDGDHQIDLLVSSYHPASQLRLFRKRHTRGFDERTEPAGLLGLTGGLNMVQGDYDNDGDVDVLVLRGAWLGDTGRHPNSLLRNNGDGTFTDVTFETGVGEHHYPTQTAAWADYDLDGHLDLYIGNESTKALQSPAQLFHNNGDGTFQDVAPRAAVTNHRFTKAVTWGDYNADRWPDLFVSNLRGANRLYQNNGDGTFTDKAAELGVTDPRASFPAWFWDFDNDGHLDLFVSAYSADITHVAASYLNLPPDIEMAALYRGDGSGGFDDVATKAGLTRPTAPMGANFGDLDNDGYLDFYLGTGYPDYAELMPNIMYLNRDGERFLDVTSIGGFGHLQKGHGVAFIDFDRDGDQDVFEQMGGALAGDRFEDVLYENPGFGNHWLAIRLIGRETNRSAIGARIRVEFRESGNVRSVYRHVNSGGSFGANPLEQTIGLGNAEEVRAVEVYWPKTDRRQTLNDVPLDARLVIVESGAWFVIE